MVMLKKNIQMSKYAMLMIGIGIVSGQNVYADGFYTIIGPDGRPMIVPKKDTSQQLQSQVRNIEKESTLPNKIIENKVETPVKLSNSQNRNIQSDISNTRKIEKIEPAIVEQNVESQKTLTIEIPLSQESKSVQTLESKKLKTKDINQKEKDSKVVTPINNKELKKESNTSAQQKDGFTSIDGVSYVNNEYLEGQEFNLEGKKRFYTMPDGSGRLETIERKKGVSRSMLDRIMSRPMESSKAITLSTNYVRLTPEDLALAFEEDRCFVENYTKSIKKLSLNKDIGLWPRKPLKEKFEYELVELDNPITYIQIDSYASSNNKPVYYWPLVIFLDKKGCIQEGVSGFKNETVHETTFKHAAIQGVLRVPETAHYVMMTPLASAVDVPEQELSNQGQIKISVIQ